MAGGRIMSRFACGRGTFPGDRVTLEDVDLLLADAHLDAGYRLSRIGFPAIVSKVDSECGPAPNTAG